MTVNLFIVYPPNYLVGTKNHLFHMLCSRSTPEQLPILIGTFLLKKLLDIISSFPTTKRPSSVIDCNSSFDEFILISLSDISSLLEATHSCSPIDPLPLAILKQVTNPIAILLKSMIHHSLTTGSLHNAMKLATTTPFLLPNTIPLPTYPLTQKSSNES